MDAALRQQIVDRVTRKVEQMVTDERQRRQLEQATNYRFEMSLDANDIEFYMPGMGIRL